MHPGDASARRGRSSSAMAGERVGAGAALCADPDVGAAPGSAPGAAGRNDRPFRAAEYLRLTGSGNGRAREGQCLVRRRNHAASIGGGGAGV